jgi:MFS family permease
MRGALSRLGALIGWWDALRYPGTRRVLSANSLVDATGSGLATICLPFYSLLVAHLSAAHFAVVLSCGGIAELAAGVPNGALASRFGVYRFVIVTRFVHAAGFIVYAFVGSFPALVILSIVIGIFRGGGVGLNQSLITSIAGDQRQSTLAATRALRNVGYLCASGLGAAVIAFHDPALLRGALVVNGLSFLVSASLLRRVRPADVAGRADAALDWSVLRDLPYLGLIVAATVFTASVTVLDVALPLWMLRHDDVPRAMIGVAFAVNTVLVLLLQYAFSMRAETVKGACKNVRYSVVAFLAMAVVFVIAAAVPPWAAALCVVFIAVLLTLGELYESPAWWTLSFDLAPRERSTEYLATFGLVYALVSVIGPPMAVMIVDHGVAGWIGYAAAITMASAYISLIVRHRAREDGTSPVSESVRATL